MAGLYDLVQTMSNEANPNAIVSHELRDHSKCDYISWRERRSVAAVLGESRYRLTPRPECFDGNR